MTDANAKFGKGLSLLSYRGTPIRVGNGTGTLPTGAISLYDIQNATKDKTYVTSFGGGWSYGGNAYYSTYFSIKGNTFRFVIGDGAHGPGSWLQPGNMAMIGPDVLSAIEVTIYNNGGGEHAHYAPSGGRGLWEYGIGYGIGAPGYPGTTFNNGTIIVRSN